MSRIARLTFALVGGLVLAVLVPLSPASAGAPPLYATAGTPFNGVVASFAAADCVNGCIATIDWGDGAATSAAASANGRSVDVSGAHTYAKGGLYQVLATLQQCSKCSRQTVTRQMTVANASVTTTTTQSSPVTAVATPTTTRRTTTRPTTTTPTTHAGSSTTSTTAAAASPGTARGARIAYVVNGVVTSVSEVRGDVVALARNKGLNLVKIKESGDLSPALEVVASYLTTLIHDAVTAQELQRRGVTVTTRQLKIARRIDIRVYGKKAWNEFPARFRTRDVQRTARAVALAADEGFDLTKPRQARNQLVALVIDLVRKAKVTVNPRFGTWNSDLAVVVPPQEGTPS